MVNINFAQSNLIRDQLSVDKQNSFSKSLNLINVSTLMESINNGNAITVFLPSDYAINNMEPAFADQLFNQKNKTAIETFFKRYSIDGLWDSSKLLSNIDASTTPFTLANRNSEKFILSRNGQLIMITTPMGFEVNTEFSLIINNSVIFFMDGLIK